MKSKKQWSLLIVAVLAIGFSSYLVGKIAVTNQKASVNGIILAAPGKHKSDENEEASSGEDGSSSLSGSGGIIEPFVTTNSPTFAAPKTLTSPWIATFTAHLNQGNTGLPYFGQRYFKITPSGASSTTVMLDPTPTQHADYGSGPISGITIVRPLTLTNGADFSYVDTNLNPGRSYTVQGCVQFWNSDGPTGLGSPFYYAPGTNTCYASVSFTVPASLSPVSGSLGQSCNTWLNNSNYGAAPLRGTATETISSFSPSTNYPGEPFTSTGYCAYHTTNPSLIGQSGNCIIKPTTFTDSQSYPTASCTNNITTTPPPVPGQTILIPHGPHSSMSAVETIVTMIQGLHD